MRYLRTAMVAVVLTAAFIAPSAASAQIATARTGTTAQLGPEGASVHLPVTVNCTAGFLAFLNVRVDQSTGSRLATAGGSSVFLCSGSDQTMTVNVVTFSTVPYKQGKATARALLEVTDPVTGEIVASVEVGPQQIRIRK
jgi:hypothetical protein